MLGSVLAVTAAALFSLNAAFARRGTVKVADASVGVFISVFLGLPYFAAVLAALGKLPTVLELSWESYFLLGTAGIINYILGRSFNYAAIRLLGANMAVVLTATNPLYAVILGIAVLGEAMSVSVVLGAVLIVAGAMLVAWNPRSGLPFGRVTTPRGIILGLMAGIFYGIAPFLMKLGLRETHPMAAAFISYLTASAILGLALPWKLRQPGFGTMKQATFIWFLLASLSVTVAHTVRFVALSLSPVSVVTPLASTGPLFIILFSFLFNRHLEHFSPTIVLGAGAVVLGAVLLF